MLPTRFLVLNACLTLPLFPASALGQSGSLDPLMGIGGVSTLWSVSDVVPKAIAIQDDGDIVVAGLGGYNSPPRTWWIARFAPDGSLDTGFASGGIQTLFGQNGDDQAQAIAIDKTGGAQDGKIYVAGAVFQPNGGLWFGLVRILPQNGLLDPTFGSGGIVTTSFRKGSVDTAFAQALVIQPDGRIVVGGTALSQNTGEDFAVARYLPSGALDTSFGGSGHKSGSGKITTAMSSGSERLRSLALDANGRIVAGGAPLGGPGWFIARYTSSGALDTSFHGDGKITSGLGLPFEAVTSVAVVQPGNRVLACGRALFPGTADFDVVLARYDSGGTVDTSFGTGGFCSSGFAGEEQPSGQFAVQSDGKIVVPCNFNVQGSCEGGDFSVDSTVLRFLPNGGLDPTFGNGGAATPVTEHPVPGATWMYATALDAFGRITCAGAAFQQCVTPHPYPQLTRWLAD